MPRYDFLNTETNEIEEHMMSYTKLDEFKENNPHLKTTNQCIEYSSAK